MPAQRLGSTRLLVIDPDGRRRHTAASRLAECLAPGDLVVANDAATIPASLRGVHLPTGEEVEVRLAGRTTLATCGPWEFTAVVFGAGDHRLRTEDRPLPPPLAAGDAMRLGPLEGEVTRIEGHPRLVRLRLRGLEGNVWEGISRHGRPVQYTHVPEPLGLGEVWTPVAALPVAFEAPSASYALFWSVIDGLRARGIDFATVTLAAGLSSTGDPELDRRLPLDEAYRVPHETAHVIAETERRGGRVIAIGTTVTRALEAAATADGVVRAGDGIAPGRLGPTTPLRVVDAILTGVHEPGTSHYDLLRAFAPAAALEAIFTELEAYEYRPHEFGDAILLARLAADHNHAPYPGEEGDHDIVIPDTARLGDDAMGTAVRQGVATPPGLAGGRDPGGRVSPIASKGDRTRETMPAAARPERRNNRWGRCPAPRPAPRGSRGPSFRGPPTRRSLLRGDCT